MPLTNYSPGLARAKPIYPRYRLDSERFRVGAQRGLTAEVNDPRGEMWALLGLLDGERSLRSVTAEMQAQFGHLSPTDIEQGIAKLDAEGFLDDPRPSAFDTDPGKYRYVGNVNYFSHFCDSSTTRGAHQERLLDTRIALLGLGGGGSTILQLLGAVGIGGIRAVDRDVVEVTNLNRQLLYGPSEVGTPKAVAAHAALRRQNPTIKAEFITAELCSVEQVTEMIEGADLVVCAVDEPQLVIQRIVNRACVRKGLPCVYGLSQVTRGRVFSVLPFIGGCIDCLHLYYTDRDPDFKRQYAAIRDARFHSPPLAYAPNVARLCAELVDEVVRIVTSYRPPRSLSTQLEVDFERGTTFPLLSWPRDLERCPSCGDGREDDLAALLGTAVVARVGADDG